MIGKWGFSLLPFYLGIIPIFANNNYTLTLLSWAGLYSSSERLSPKYIWESYHSAKKAALKKKDRASDFSEDAVLFCVWLYSILRLCRRLSGQLLFLRICRTDAAIPSARTHTVTVPKTFAVSPVCGALEPSSPSVSCPFPSFF